MIAAPNIEEELMALIIILYFPDAMRSTLSLSSYLSLMGLGGQRLWLFPLVQALVSSALALVVSFAIFGVAAMVAEHLFDTGGAAGSLVEVTTAQAIIISASVTAFVALSSLMAAFSALRIDPATVLREGAT